MPPKGYKSVSLPRCLAELVEGFIKNHKELGYRSTAEFISEAVRLRLEKLRQDEKASFGG